MKKLYSVVLGLFIATSTTQLAQSNTMVRVKAIGSSPRGQYVAFEEFGYQNGRQSPFSKIRIMNVWKSKYVSRAIEIMSADNKMKLSEVRLKAQGVAAKTLKEFNISI